MSIHPEVSISTKHLTRQHPKKVEKAKEPSSPTGSACLWRWSNNFVLLENMLPHVGQATSLSWVWLRMCSLRRYLILKKASQPVTETREHRSHYIRASTVGHKRDVSLTFNLHTCPVTEESLLLLWERLWLRTFNMIVHMSVEPLRIVKCALNKEKKTINSVTFVVLSIFWWPMKNSKNLHHSAPTGKRIHLILQEPGCCCVSPGCNWAGQDGTWATVTRQTWACRGSCGSKRGPPALRDYPWREIHIHSRDKHTHLKEEKGVFTARKKGELWHNLLGVHWQTE